MKTFFQFHFFSGRPNSVWEDPAGFGRSFFYLRFDKSISIDFSTEKSVAGLVYDLRTYFCINQSEPEDLKLGAKLKTLILVPISIEQSNGSQHKSNRENSLAIGTLMKLATITKSSVMVNLDQTFFDSEWLPGCADNHDEH